MQSRHLKLQLFSLDVCALLDKAFQIACQEDTGTTAIVILSTIPMYVGTIEAHPDTASRAEGPAATLVPQVFGSSTRNSCRWLAVLGGFC